MTRDFIEALVSDPVTIAAAGRAAGGGIPDKSGLYAWWLASDDALPAVPLSPHPTEPGLRLLYVGVAPRDAASQETLRSRALKKHVGSGLAGSTFRRSLAALLWEEKDWTPRLTETGRFKFSPEDDAALRAWQELNLRLSWVPVERPRDTEDFAISELEPPFNLAGNLDHPFYEGMSNARACFKAKAEAFSRKPG
ncbi:MAG: hypothetical protein H0T96_03455 [Thermoleophilaceae bacterium]|nr:hypothetical protein [Thermoleophilaceae bacterium]